MTFSESQTQEALAHGRRRAVVTGLRAKNGTEYPLAIHPRRWIIGSGPNCDVVIDDPYVSATHCVLERRAGGTMHVRDRKSRNGTLIDGNLVEVAAGTVLRKLDSVSRQCLPRCPRAAQQGHEPDDEQREIVDPSRRPFRLRRVGLSG